MKTVEVVVTAKGWYVTRRYGGQNKGAEFFSFVAKNLDQYKKKSDRQAAIQKAYNDAVMAKDNFIKAWMGK